MRSMSFRVTDTSLDPYVRAFQPTLSPYTTAIGQRHDPRRRRAVQPRRAAHRRRRSSSSICGCSTTGCAIRGRLPLAVEGQTLQIESAAPGRRRHGARPRRAASICDRQALSLQADGAANLAALQGFVPRRPQLGPRGRLGAHRRHGARSRSFPGQALLTEGRLRHFSFPHALEELNGIVTFNASGIRLDGAQRHGWAAAR